MYADNGLDSDYSMNNFYFWKIILNQKFYKPKLIKALLHIGTGTLNVLYFLIFYQKNTYTMVYKKIKV